MRSRWVFAMAVAVASVVGAVGACTGDDPDLSSPKEDAGATTDGSGGVDAPAADSGPDKTCRAEDPFEVLNTLGGVNDGAPLFHPRLTADELEIYYQHGLNAIFYATRATKAQAFSAGSPIPMQDAGVLIYDPAISGNKLALYVSLDNRIARLSRATPTSSFGPPKFLDLAADAGNQDQDPHVLGDESALYFTRFVADAGSQIWRAAGDGDGGFSGAAKVDLGTTDDVANAWVSDDEHAIYLSHGPTLTMRRSFRNSVNEAFPAPTSVEEINAKIKNGNPRPGWLSPDLCRLYFAAGVGGGVSQIWLAERTPR